MGKPCICVSCRGRWVLVRVALAGFLLALAWPGQVWAQGINFDAATEKDSGANTVTSLTWSHTVAGSNRILMVGVSLRNSGTPNQTVGSVTYNTVGLTWLGSAGYTTNSHVEIWYLVGPATGAHNVVVTLTAGNAATRIVAGAASFTGVKQTTPLGSFMSAASTTTSSPATVDVTSVNEGEVVMDCLMVRVPSGTTTTATAAGGQTQRWNAVSTYGSSSNARGASSHKPGPVGGGTVTMSWTLSNNQYWAIGAVALKPANVVPTAVKLSSFSATRHADRVLVQWRTGFEADNLGFHIYREQGGELRRVTSSLVAGSAFLTGQATAFTAGRSYAWMDILPAGTGPARYWLEDWDLRGKRTMHGPVSPVYSDGLLSENDQLESEISQLPMQRSVQLSDLGRVASEFDGEPAARSSPRTLSFGPMIAANQNATKPSSGERLATQWKLASQPAVKIVVRKEGWYRISQPQLVAAGLSAGALSGKLQLFADGVEQSLVVKAKSAWQFLPSDWIEFYGTGLDTQWTDSRTYWLVEGNWGGKRVGTVTAAGVASSAASFAYTVEKKDRAIYFAALLNGEDNNFFGSVVTTVPTDEMIEASHLDPLPPGDAQLHVRLQGVTFAAHSVAVLVNGTDVGTVAFKDQQLATGQLQVPSALLKSGANTVRLIARGGDMDVSMVDVLRLTYWHTWTADGDALRVTVPAGKSVTIGGFTSAAIRAMDVSDPDTPVELRGSVVQQSQGYAITIGSGAWSRDVLLFTDGGIGTPASVSANQPSNWHQAAAGADVVIISHSTFLPSLAALKAAQEREGWKVALVDVQDCYDDFSFGAKTPQAIKDFVSQVRRVWKTVPKFLLLVGDASFDPRNYLGLGGFDFMPTKMIDTTYLETSSDDWFVDFNGLGYPQMAVGRLPARTAAEAATMVSKILSFRQRDPSASWTKQALLVADEDDTFDFEGASAQVKALLPGSMSVREVYRGRMGGGTRQALLQSLNDGNLLVNYAGHGSVEMWDGDVLTSDDAPTLTNQSRLPLFVIMDCLSGYFSDLYTESLAEALMKAGTGGAVGVWASSGLTEPGEQAIMNRSLYGYLFQPAITVGEAILKAKLATSDGDVRRAWLYFGDPTLRLSPAR